MSQGIYICTANDNRVLDSSDNLVFIHKVNNIESDSEEIGSYNNVYYCSTDNYFEPYEKQITTEQEFINRTFEIYNSTKTIDEAIQVLVDGGLGTKEEVKTALKSYNPSVNWSF
jgi:hypothetical protein